MFCPNCGTGLDNYAPAAPAEPMEITLARIEKDRAVEVARIEAAARRAELATEERVAEVQAEADGEQAGAVAAIVTATAAEAAPEPEPVPVDPEPVVITQVNDDADQQDVAPPVVEHEEPAEPKRRGLGMW
jgi:hypothetical protein